MKYDRTQATADCPVCHETDALKLWETTTREAAQHFVLRTRDEGRNALLESHIAELWKGSSCQVLECTTCGFCFAHPFVAGDERFYTLAYDRALPDSYPKWKWEYERTLAALRPVAQNHHSLLEIGAGDGAFLKRMTEILDKSRLLSTEFSEYGRSAIHKLGIECLPIDVRKLVSERPAERFDFICLFQVVEHLDDLHSLFHCLQTLLNPSGNLFIAVPGSDHIRENELIGGLLDMPPNHTGRWTKKAFEHIAANHGLQVDCWETGDRTLVGGVSLNLRYYFARRMQMEGTVASKVSAVPNRHVRRVLQGLVLAATALLNPKLVIRGFVSPPKVQWVQMSKQQSELRESPP